MYLLNEFANRYKKEIYKKLGSTQKQKYKQELSKPWNVNQEKYAPSYLAQKTLEGKNKSINAKLRTELYHNYGKNTGFFNEDPITRINIDRRNRIEYLKDKLANKTKSVPNIGYKVITDSPKINVANVNTSKAITNTTKIPKTKLLSKTKLAIGITAATGIGLLAANKLRKSRSDKNKKRNKYNKRKL